MNNKLTPDKNYIEIIERYCYKCDRTIRNLGASSKRNIINVMPLLFKKWFFSSLMDNTIVSPANLLAAEMDDEVGFGTFIDLDLNIVNHKYETNYVLVSKDTHPFINDLKTLLDFSSPAIELDNESFLSASKKEQLKPLIAFNDKYYADYLMLIAVNLGLFEKMPSLFASVYTPSKKIKSFFDRDGLEIIEDILDAVFDICSGKITYELFLPNSSFNKNTLNNYFENSVAVNQIIKDLYTAVGINIDKTMENYNADNINKEDRELLSSVNYVGHLIDRWYITPLSIYLRLIRPLYPMNDDLTENLNFIADVMAINAFAEGEIFSPPNLYTMTPLGKLLCPYKDSSFIQDIPKNIPLSTLYDTLSKAFTTEKFNYDIEDFAASARKILTLRVSYANEPKKWITFEVDSDMVISSLFVEITDVFALGNNFDYSFTKVSDNIETIYAYSEKNGFFNDPERVSLFSVFNNLNDKLLLDIPQISTKMVIELTKKSSGKAGIVYPRPIRESKAMDKLRETY